MISFRRIKFFIRCYIENIAPDKEFHKYNSDWRIGTLSEIENIASIYEKYTTLLFGDWIVKNGFPYFWYSFKKSKKETYMDFKMVYYEEYEEELKSEIKNRKKKMNK